MTNARQLFRVSFLSVAVGTAALLGGLPAAPAAFAQDQASGQVHAHNRVADFLMTMNLTDDQKTKIRSIMADARKQNANVTDRQEKRENMKAAMGKVRGVLTPAQQTQFDQKMAALRAQYQANQTAH